MAAHRRTAPAHAAHPTFGAGDARTTVTLVAATPAKAAPPARPGMAFRFAAEFDRYWAFFLWVVVIAAGMWPPLLAPLAAAAFPSAAVAGRAAGVLVVWVSERERERGGGGERGRRRWRLEAGAAFARRGGDALVPHPPPRPPAPRSPSAPPPPGAAPSAATS